MNAYDVVAGHISMLDARRYFPRAALLTILRDPIDRCLSWYYFARQVMGISHPDVVAAQNHDVEAFFALDEQVVFRNIFNRQVRQLGDHVLNEEVDLDAALIRAKSVLAECVWVGRQEHLDADIARLASVFPQMEGMAARQVNVTHGRRSLAQPDPALAAKIARYNRYDFELYAYAESLLAD